MIHMHSHVYKDTQRLSVGVYNDDLGKIKRDVRDSFPHLVAFSSFDPLPPPTTYSEFTTFHFL